MSLQRYEPINGSDFVDIMLRVKKINRTTSVLSGNMNLLTDMDSTWFVCAYILYNILEFSDFIYCQMSVTFWNSPKGNNQFNLYPMKLSNQTVCEFVSSDYYIKIKKKQDNNKNLPEVGVCPIKKGNYIIENLIFGANAELVPPVVPDGLWKMVIILQHEGVTRHLCNSYVRLDRFYF